ncbi:8aa0a43c-5df7-4906-8180-596506e74159 [Sclerotinia trifoliorum]|uniref:8aa0a43c-5df7-4906-8180-596506e74159 n=1 Tax=Sclerotinia trifoliorum TaxID=28548 RepID=A0A8H2VZC7_9HELO|nr:8aa0a43c-5df7-4906-8180-596506e74159 [Sclerotinia trifoliorum]
MFSKTILISLLVALVEARFGQEQGNGAIAAITALSDFGTSGAAATLGGQSIQFLLGAANPCGKLTQADTIVAQLGNDSKVISAARGLVAAEQNFNPFVVSVPNICSDPTLPTTAALRGVVPLIDPSVVGSETENANSAKSTTTPFAADGLSVADVMVAQGFSNFTTTDAAGNKGTPSGSSAAAGSVSASGSTPSAASSGVSSVAVAAVAAASSGIACGGTTFITVTMAATSATAAPTSISSSSSTSSTNSSSTVQASSISGLSFGLCVPTMKFEAGLNGRKDTEFTFQAIDPLVNKGQEEALNPNIITNRICDQLTNVCNANEAAKTACAQAKAMISAAGTKDVSTANAWNTALGFEGADTNPDGAPKAGLVGHS